MCSRHHGRLGRTRAGQQDLCSPKSSAGRDRVIQSALARSIEDGSVGKIYKLDSRRLLSRLPLPIVNMGEPQPWVQRRVHPCWVAIGRIHTQLLGEKALHKLRKPDSRISQAWPKL